MNDVLIILILCLQIFTEEALPISAGYYNGVEVNAGIQTPKAAT
jgi:hypothetical protein